MPYIFKKHVQRYQVKRKLNDETSLFFFCNLGVRQGENLSPFLFSMYIYDIEKFMNERSVNGLNSITTDLEEELLFYRKLFILFYADDTVILTESAQDLQHALDEFCILYCKYWKLTVNVKKTKVMIFSKGPAPKCSFMYNNDKLEIVKEYNYIGILFSRSGYFCKAKKHLCTQSQKAMYGFVRKIRYFDMSCDIQLDLFVKNVLPALQYSCEIWGYENIDVIERVHLRFLKHILNLKNSTPRFMVCGETGRFALYITIYTRMIGFWAKMMLCQENKLCKTMYMYLYNCYI